MAHCLNEVTREVFWKIEDAIARGDTKKVSGDLHKEATSGGKVYKDNSGTVWMREHSGIWFADKRLVKFAK